VSTVSTYVPTTTAVTSGVASATGTGATPTSSSPVFTGAAYQANANTIGGVFAVAMAAAAML